MRSDFGWNEKIRLIETVSDIELPDSTVVEEKITDAPEGLLGWGFLVFRIVSWELTPCVLLNIL